MGRKHGFRGTPVKPSNRLSSVGGIFERRGDPMVSDREGREKYGRNLETENPDYDRYFTKLASDLRQDILKPSQIDKGNAFRSSVANQKDRSKAVQNVATNTILVMRAAMRKAQGETVEYQGKSSDLISCPKNCGFASKDSRKVAEHLRIPLGQIGACRNK